ncbi:MAG TPA: GNAT family N-acetyltransferase [Candidatus Thermoplasmatota archaeon]|nr:GNAT family N-acetyltransferase [Candidatus Thermoplasmatota archaeon]
MRPHPARGPAAKPEAMPTGRPAIRPAGPEDAAEVGRLLRLLGCVRWTSEAEMDRRIGAFLRRASATRILVAGPVGGPLGAAAIVHVMAAPVEDASQLLLDDLVVDPACRGQGLGGALLAAVLELARREGAVRIHARVDAQEPAAARLYQQHGLRPSSDTVYLWEAADG